jgi:hypothetical protein
MQLARPLFALDPRRFGRGPVRVSQTVDQSPSIAGDLQLFATTYIGGFIFVSILLA